jgi:hypothetical protein
LFLWQALEPLPRMTALPAGFASRDPAGPEFRLRERLYFSVCRRFAGVGAHLVHANPETHCLRKGGKQSSIRAVRMSGLVLPAASQPEYGQQGTNNADGRMRLENVSGIPQLRADDGAKRPRSVSVQPGFFQ